jgi:hypothetical protein
MAHTGIPVKLDVGASPPYRRDSAFHHRWRRNAILLTDDDEPGRLVRRHVRMAGVRHHHC